MVTTLEIRHLPSGVTQAREPNPYGSTSRSSGSAPSLDLLISVQDRFPMSKSTVSDLVEDTVRESHLHKRIQIGSLLDPRLRLRESVTLKMEQDDEFHVAWCEELNEYGYGPDPISAVQDARNTIAELYWQLKTEQERLGPDLANTWKKLSCLVYEV